jgi:hypothetical protein
MFDALADLSKRGIATLKDDCYRVHDSLSHPAYDRMTAEERGRLRIFAEAFISAPVMVKTR